MRALSHDELDAFSAPLQTADNIARLARDTGWEERQAGLYLASILGEAHLGLTLLDWAGLNADARVLEVGAGAGLLSAFLQARGVALTAIEPVAQGFDATLAARTIVARGTGMAPDISPLEARQLDPARDGPFDVIFSVNVIEHFQPLQENLDGMARVMAPGGVQVHTCPNYRIPYEPHYGVPLLPFFPGRTPPAARHGDGLWRSLNFITAGDVHRYARAYGLQASFQRGTMGASLRRLRTEKAFAARQPPLLHHIASLSHWTGLTALLGAVPPELATPMTFCLRKDGASAPSR